MIDIDASGAAVAESVAGECAEEALKAGRRAEFGAQRGAIHRPLPVLHHGDRLDGGKQQRGRVIGMGPVRRGG